MNEDRSRNGRNGDHADGDGARERWYERLLTRFGLKSRESIRDDLEDALEQLTTTDDGERDRSPLDLGFHYPR